MKGSWRLTVWFGVFGAALTFLFSISHNKIGTTLLRSVYAFLAFAALALIVRLVLGILLRPAPTPAVTSASEDRGQTLDMVTPDDDGLAELMKEQWADGKDKPIAGFQPLNPAKLVSLDQPKTEDMVQAVRRMTNE
ncbi:hypothetical protein [Cohnella zeiphila]|uniref:Uncharacterized protein n=1 Tax=Cohnella zeiphila TaxID=2761120 RepID=A0A7X0SMT2_9BACL|nr:hypothetical protein [Cohnella zeiphila]MBB6732875.1 hypothetical protein [Cohnella zeiphila]